MANTTNKTFVAKNGLTIGNTQVFDTIPDLWGIANVHMSGTILIGNTDLYGVVNTAYSLANTANANAGFATVSQNSSGTLYNKILNFVNTQDTIVTVTDKGDGNANIAITLTGLTMPYATRTDSQGNSILYKGIANVGSSNAAAVWQISLITFDSPNTGDVIIQYANGNPGFVNVWDQRATLSYS